MVRKQSKNKLILFAIFLCSIFLLLTSSPSLADTFQSIDGLSQLELNIPHQLNSHPQTCGVPSNSENGYGAVELCGVVYPCGVSDDVCPEDFFDSGEGDGLQGNCSNCADPDCLALAKVQVYNPQGAAESGVSITISYAGSHLPVIPSRVTNISGEVSFDSIYSGFATVTAQKFGFATQVKEVLFERKNDQELIVFQEFKEASCEADCTRESSIYCDADCHGSNGCEFPTPNVEGLGTIDFKTICAPPQTNSSKNLVGYVDGTAYFANCGSGELDNQSRPIIDLTKQNLLISGLMNHVQSVRLHGEQIFLVATTFKTNN